jgi:hypothetical protein
MAHDAHEEDTWLVQLASGDVRMMDLDQLDEAFQNGTVDENTLVRRDGASKWVKLSEELGDHTHEHEPAPTPAPASIPAPAPVSVAPKPQTTASTAPVVADVLSAHDAHEELEAALRSARRRRWVIGSVMATAVLGALGAVTVVNVMRMRAHGPVIAEIPTVHVAAPSDPEPEETTKTTDNKDANRARRHRNRAAQGTGGTTTSDDKPASTVFQNGGDQYDPLNGKL